eukprot:164809-Amphidinium_carterae.1
MAKVVLKLLARKYIASSGYSASLGANSYDTTKDCTSSNTGVSKGDFEIKKGGLFFWGGCGM